MNSCLKLQNQIENLRMIANYYRVKFYGENFNDQDEKEFIYKFGPKENLMTVQGKLKVRHKCIIARPLPNIRTA